MGAEDADSWKFFLYHLKNALQPSGRGDNWCIISNRQKVYSYAPNMLVIASVCLFNLGTNTFVDF